MGRSIPKFSSFSPPYSGEEKMLLQLDLAGKVVYLLILIVLLLLYLRKWKRNRRVDRRVQTANRVNVVRGDNGGETIRGQIARRVRANVAGGEVGDTTGGQYAGEIAMIVRANVAVGEVRDTTGDQYAGEVRFDVAGDDDGGTIDGQIARGGTSLAATMPFEFN